MSSLANKAKKSVAGPPRFKCSPLKKARPPTIVAMSFKNSGVRRIVQQYSQVEDEASKLRKQHFESKEKIRWLKKEMKEQSMKSRKLLVTCAIKLRHREVQLEELSQKRLSELNSLSQDLIRLESNMRKEQKRLQEVVRGQAKTIAKQQEEIIKLRDELKSKNPEVDTPSSSSPESSPTSKTPKFRIRTPLKDTDQNFTLPSPLPPPESSKLISRRRSGQVPWRGQSPNDAFVTEPSIGMWIHQGDRLVTPSVRLTNLRSVRRPKDVKRQSKSIKVSSLSTRRDEAGNVLIVV